MRAAIRKETPRRRPRPIQAGTPYQSPLPFRLPSITDIFNETFIQAMGEASEVDYAAIERRLVAQQQNIRRRVPITQPVPCQCRMCREQRAQEETRRQEAMERERRRYEEMIREDEERARALFCPDLIDADTPPWER